MASNTSQRKAQAIILASPVEAFRTWFLIVGCEPCGPRAVRMSGFPVGLTICQVIMRLRCQVCGGKAVTVAIDNASDGHRRRVVKVWGPGSYG